MRLHFPDGDGGELYATGEELHSFTINRPAGRYLFGVLFELMRRAELALYWPSLKPSLVVTDVALIGHPPHDLIASIGLADVAGSGDDIVSAINNS